MEAVRKAAALNKLDVIGVSEAPVELDSESAARSGKLAPGMHRYLIERTFPAGALEGLNSDAKAKVNATNSKFGAQWVTSYANAAKTKTYCIYEGADEAAIRQGRRSQQYPGGQVTEVPVTARLLAKALRPMLACHRDRLRARWHAQLGQDGRDMMVHGLGNEQALAMTELRSPARSRPRFPLRVW